MTLRRKQALDGLDADIRDHIDRETQDNIDRGLSPDEARRQAMVAFGNAALVKEDTRSIWFRVWAEELSQDVRYACRLIRRDRVFAAVVVLTLAIAIGMNTAIFSVFNAVVLRPISYPSSERLVSLSTVGAEEELGFVTGPDFVEWRDHATSFDFMVAYGTVDYTLASAQGATRVRAATVTGDYWEMSGAVPEAGRLPRSNEQDVVLISRRFAQRWFAGAPDVIGRTVHLNGRQVTIVAILPERSLFHLPGPAGPDLRRGDVDVYEPMFVSSRRRRGPVPLLSVVGRLRPGIALGTARAELEAIRSRIANAHPRPFDDQRTLRIVPLHEQVIGKARQALLVLLGAVAFVLLIACANTASLLLARSSVRRREIAIRMSVGAGRARVFRQLLVESLVLAVLAGAVGGLLARLGVAAILRIDAHAVPRMLETTVDARVLAAVLGTSVLTALTFGLAPACALWKTHPHEALRDSRMSPGTSSVRIRKVLVAAEVALALMLLVGAGLMVKSAWRMHAYAPGFEPERVLTAKIELTGPRYSDARRSLAFADALLQRLRAEAGVEAVSISTHGYMLSPRLMVEGEPVPTPEELGSKPPIMINASSAALKQILGFRLSRGRWFTDGEAAVVLNQSLARREMGGRDPIGRRIQLADDGPLLTIVGVAEDVQYSQLDAPAEPEVYVPFQRVPDGLFGFTALILTGGDPLGLAPSVRHVVAEIDKTQVPEDMMTLEHRLTESVAPRRLNLLLLGTFAAVALLLALVGIYGVMAYSVTQRFREIGVRLALGAQRIHVIRTVISQGMVLTTVGIVGGVIGALGLTRFLESLLYDVRPTDPWTIAVMAISIGAAGLLACSVPALKAGFVDPATTLRDE